MRPAQAREGAHGSTNKNKAPPDMLTGQSKQVCLRREMPTDHVACSHEEAQRRQLRRVATTELWRESTPEAKATHAKHDHIHKGHDYEAGR